MPKFGPESLAQLKTCDIRLQKIANEVIKYWDCKVLEGKRSEEQQRRNVAKGVSQTMKSKHVYPLDKPALAMDLSPFPVDWKDTNRFYAFGGFVIGIATSMGIKLRWGGDWDSDRDLRDQSFNDLPHFEIDE